MRKPVGMRAVRASAQRPKRPQLSDFTLREQLHFLSAWRPANEHGPIGGRWRTWDEYLADFRAVREKLVEHFGERLRHLPTGRPFGDRVLAYVEAHGIEALADVEGATLITYEGGR